MISPFVFTEIVNCARIGKIALESYLRYHDHPVHVFGSANDFVELGELADAGTVLPISIDDIILEKFKRGHEGTAALFAKICVKSLGPYTAFVHFDSDIFFKKESLSEILRAFDDGYDIVGTRRCYGNNPGGVKGLNTYPDTISTYFMGVHLDKFPDYNMEYLAKMWQGAWHPLGWPILDFGDAVTQTMWNNGARINFLDWNKFGSQSEFGNKTNDYELNLHMDCGSHLIHMGGVGSGYAYFHDKSKPEKSYGEWAIGRYALFEKVFYNNDIGYGRSAIYGPDGRWIDGGYDENILRLIKKEIE